MSGSLNELKMGNVRVLMIISLFYPQMSGAEKQCLELSKRLLKENIEVSLLTQKIGNYPEYQEIEGIRIYRKIKTINLGFLWGVSYILSTLYFLLKNRKRYDIIHCHSLYLHTFAAVVFKYLFCRDTIVISKISCTGNYGDFERIEKIFLSNFLLRVTRRIDRVIPVSKDGIEELLAHNFSLEKICLIPNGVDGKRFQPLDKNSAGQNITFIGRMDKQKGVEYLIDAFCQVAKDHPVAKLTLVGDGPIKRELEEQVGRCGLSEKVNFTGFVEDIREYYYHTDILVLPSLAEGMSNVLLEGMACALPIITTAIGGNVDLIDDNETGLLIPPKNAAALKEAIMTLLNNKVFCEKLGRNARKRVEEIYCLDKIIGKYKKLYHKLKSETTDYTDFTDCIQKN